jgi:hypothetical protein
MLSARASGAGKPPFQFVERYGERRCHPEDGPVVISHDATLPAKASRPVT